MQMPSTASIAVKPCLVDDVLGGCRIPRHDATLEVEQAVRIPSGTHQGVGSQLRAHATFAMEQDVRVFGQFAQDREDLGVWDVKRKISDADLLVFTVGANIEDERCPTVGASFKHFLHRDLVNHVFPGRGRGFLFFRHQIPTPVHRTPFIIGEQSCRLGKVSHPWAMGV